MPVHKRGGKRTPAPLLTAVIQGGNVQPGTPNSREDISVIQVVKTHPRRGHATINIRKITLIGDSARVLFQAQQGSGWRIPDHFGGMPEGHQQAGQGNVRDLPYHFEVLPGNYQIDYLYVPAADKWGWTHRPSAESTISLDCEAGRVYLLEGKLREDGNGWLLNSTERSGGG